MRRYDNDLASSRTMDRDRRFLWAALIVLAVVSFVVAASTGIRARLCIVWLRTMPYGWQIPANALRRMGPDVSKYLIAHIRLRGSVLGRVGAIGLLCDTGGPDALAFFHRVLDEDAPALGVYAEAQMFNFLRDNGNRETAMICLDCVERGFERFRGGGALGCLAPPRELLCLWGFESLGMRMAKRPQMRYAALIDLLDDCTKPFGRLPGDSEIRQRVNDILIKHSGRDFGFRTDATETERLRAIAAWRDWLNQQEWPEVDEASLGTLLPPLTAE